MDTLERKYAQALLRATDIMIAHGLGDWGVGYHRKLRSLADCSDTHRRIRYNKTFLAIATEEQLVGVTLHEVAHALVGARHHHDRVWSEKVIEIGGDRSFAKSKYDGLVFPYRYKLTCPECGTITHSNHKRGYICSLCKDNGKEVSFLFSENIPDVVLWPA